MGELASDCVASPDSLLSLGLGSPFFCTDIVFMFFLKEGDQDPKRHCIDS